MVRNWSALIAVTAGLVLLSTPAHAAPSTDPVSLGGAYVLDTNGSITGSEDRVISALDTLYDDSGLQLFVVYVDSFSSPTDPIEWADNTAISNGLGDDDALLAVATVDRQYALSIAPEFPLTDSQLDTVEKAIESELRDNNWTDAAVIGAETIGQQANTGTSPPAPQATGGFPVLPVVGGVAVVGVGVFVFSRIRKRSKDRGVTANPDQMTQPELNKRAGSLLVQLDDSVKTSEQELGFAIAQFGDEATAEFSTALAAAKAKVSEAFALRQKLDDSEPDSAESKRAWTTQIIHLCEEADAQLDAQADAFDELRALEKNAPEALAAVHTTLTTTRERMPAAQAALSALGARYVPAAFLPVADNVTQASKLLEFAAVAADKASSALADSQPSTAAIAVRSAQASVGQAGELFSAIDELTASLDATSTTLAASIADTRQDIATAQALAVNAPDPQLTAAIAAAQTAIDAAPTGSPFDSLTLVDQANQALDRVFDASRDAHEKLTRATAQLPASLTAAQSQVASAAKFIETRRGTVGSTARTRVSEAERKLAEATALATTDPVAAFTAAQLASQLAASGFQQARDDLASYERSSSYSGGYSGSDGADIGGILGELFGGSSWGGGSSGGSSGGSWGGSSRSSRSSSYGGSSRSSSRSSSRRSTASSSRSSGGSRSRGGRF